MTCASSTMRLIKHSDYESVALTEGFYSAGDVVSRHAHPLPSMGLVLYGECSHGLGLSPEESCVQGDLHCLSAGEEHSIKFVRDTSCLVLTVKPALLQRLKDSAKFAFRSGKQMGKPFRAIAQRMVSESRQDDDASVLALECLVLEAVAEMSRPRGRRSSAPSRAVLRAHELLQDRFSGPLKLGEIAHEVGMHPAHLAREFRKAFHYTMSEYLRRIRVQKALALLPLSHAPLSEISELCGFCDQSHFCRCFKQAVGMPPLAYQRQVRSHAKKS